MKVLFLTIILPMMFLILVAMGGSSHADDIADMELVKLVNKHRIYKEGSGRPIDLRLYDIPERPKQIADNHQFIRNDMDAIVDRIDIPKKPSGLEVYHGR